MKSFAMNLLIKFLLFLVIPVVSSNPSNWNGGTPSVCVDIPMNFTLCENIGYTKMKLPNLLSHDTLAEVLQQASGWFPLYQLGCSPKTKLFLCSLLTPVCLEQSVPPCRELCESVKSNCLPQMALHGFGWPRVTDCSQYPIDNGMCISSQILEQSNQRKHQRPQDNQLKSEQILNAFCQSDWVLKVKGTLIVNNLNETATLHVHSFSVLKGEFANEQQKILPVFVNDLRFWNQLLTGSGATTSDNADRYANERFTNDRTTSRYTRFNKRSIDRPIERPIERSIERPTERSSKYIQTFKKYTFILFGRTSRALNGQIYQKLTSFFPVTNKLPYLKKLYYKRIRSNRVNCNEQLTVSRTKSNLESVLYFESPNQAIVNYNQFNTSSIDV